jgi:hypothetical protein
MLFPALLVVLLAFVLRPEGSMEHPQRDCHRQDAPKRKSPAREASGCRLPMQPRSDLLQ